MTQLGDTITAIATARGAAGLAVVRMSGPEALAIADRVFRGTARIGDAPTHTLHHGWAADDALDAPIDAPIDAPMDAPIDAQRIDEVVVAVFRAPRSYTKEDVVEFSCHGGALSAERLLAAMIASGARLAAPGEFTLRAFLNGRIDLAQAEAVADVIAAETNAAHALAVSQLAGALSREIGALGERVADALAEVEARVDFAEDVGGVEVPAHVRAAIADVAAALAAWLAASPYARAIRDGARVPLVGRPNAGKSSLFNALLGEPRAIVTPAPGTTRDRVSEAIELAGMRVTLSDTAGLRETDDAIEAIGVARTHAAIASAAATLWVVDASQPLAPEDHAIAAVLGARPLLVALNKSDRPRRVAPGDVERLLDGGPRAIVAVSALAGDGIDALAAALAALLGAGPHASEDGASSGPATGAIAMAVSNPRHVAALDRARAALLGAASAADGGAPGEIVALELRASLAALGEVTGRSVDADLLDRIFSRFCVGK